MSIENHDMRRLVWGLVVATAAITACTERNPESCAADGFCVEPGKPFCDVDGEIGGSPGKCIAVECMPLTFETCRGEQALVCNSDGNDFDITNCPNGCDPASGCRPCPVDSAECVPHVVPRYLPTICNQPATLATLTVSTSMDLDTSNPLVCSSVVQQPTGPEICVLHYDTIMIERNQTYRVIGSRALALVADNMLTIDGVLDVSANGITAGPGGGLIKSGTTQGVPGGGAGYRHPGGSGGSETADGGGANGGAAGTNPALITELFGGTTPLQLVAGNSDIVGGAGGAATLISCRGTVSVPGLIDAGGGGGRGGGIQGGGVGYVPPGGGGSGGTVVLQGMMVNVTGEVYANGGAGGGGGGATLQTVGGNGGDGPRSINRAQPGLAGGTAGPGGAGGTANTPLDGKKPVSGTNAGAGGASAGYLLIYTPELVFPMLNPVGISPMFEPKGTVATAN